MGERADSVTIDTEASEPDPIQANRYEIEQTRIEMSGTIDALQEKLSPHHLAEEAKEAASDAIHHVKEAIPDLAAELGHHVKAAAAEVVQHLKETLPEAISHATHQAVHSVVEDAKEAVHKAVDSSKNAIGEAVESAKGASMSIVDRVKDNPLPAAIAGVGLYLLFHNGKKSDVSDFSGVSPQSSSSLTQSVSDTLSGVGSKAGDIAGSVKDKAGDIAGSVKDKAGDVAGAVTDKAHQGTDAFGRLLQGNPLAAGAIAVLAGVAIGLTLPSTAPENKLLGGTRDTLVDKAQDAVHDLGQKVQNVAHQTLDNVKENAQHEGLPTLG